MGTGKFKITDAQSSYIILEKNSSWWNKEKEVGLEKITVNLFSSIGELYNSFKIGNLDLIGTSMIICKNILEQLDIVQKK